MRWRRPAHCQRTFHTDHTLPTWETNTTHFKRGLSASPRGSSAYLGTYTRLQDRTGLEEFRVIRITPTISLAANLGEALNKGKATQSIQQCAGTDPKGLQCCGGGGTAQSDSTAWHQNLGPQGLRVEACVAFAQLHYSLLVLPDSP